MFTFILGCKDHGDKTNQEYLNFYNIPIIFIKTNGCGGITISYGDLLDRQTRLFDFLNLFSSAARGTMLNFTNLLLFCSSANNNLKLSDNQYVSLLFTDKNFEKFHDAIQQQIQNEYVYIYMIFVFENSNIMNKVLLQIDYSNVNQVVNYLCQQCMYNSVCTPLQKWPVKYLTKFCQTTGNLYQQLEHHKLGSVFSGPLHGRSVIVISINKEPIKIDKLNLYNYFVNYGIACVIESIGDINLVAKMFLEFFFTIR